MAEIYVDPDKVLFSAAPVYEYETVATTSYEYFKFRITLWDYLAELNNFEELALRV